MTTPSQLTAAVVGAGPAGLNAVNALLSAGISEVDVYDRQPEAGGLARYGVAPDHPSGPKTLSNLTPVLEQPGVTFHPSTEFGRDLTRAELRERHDVVVYALGCEQPRTLPIEGTDRAAHRSADDLLRWLRGTPGVEPVRLQGVRDVVIIGGGDVASDAARALLHTPQTLDLLDLPADAREALAGEERRSVTLVIWSGPEALAMKPKEMPPLLGIEGVAVRVTGLDEPVDGDLYPAVRAAQDAAERPDPEPLRATLTFAFHQRPVALVGEPDGTAVRTEPTRPGPDGLERAGEPTELPADLVLTAIGYRRTEPWPGLPFDVSTGTVPTADFRVLDAAGPAAGEYCVGWMARGATLGFGTCRREGAELLEALQRDLPTLGD